MTGVMNPESVVEDKDESGQSGASGHRRTRRVRRTLGGITAGAVVVASVGAGSFLWLRNHDQQDTDQREQQALDIKLGPNAVSVVSPGEAVVTERPFAACNVVYLVIRDGSKPSIYLQPSIGATITYEDNVGHHALGHSTEAVAGVPPEISSAAELTQLEHVVSGIPNAGCATTSAHP